MSARPTDSTETNRLLDRLYAGDPEAFDQLFERYRAYLHQVIDLRLDDRIRRRVDPSDVVQETHIDASARVPEYIKRRPMPFRVWLRKTAHERLLKIQRQHLKAQRRTAGREVQLPHHSSLLIARRLVGSGTTPSEQVHRRDLAARVRRAIARLDNLDREIVLMLDIEELTSQQVGYVLDLDPATIRKRHGRALLKLHKFLLDSGLTESQL